jgi:DeoR/GlpR family transcriptional regulator of sugar metabolism
MIAGQREIFILNRLDEQGIITVDEICTYCDCSQETARRDLRRLEKRGAILRIHGGATGGVAQEQASQARLDLGSLLEARAALVDRVEVLIVAARETASSQFLIDQANLAGVPVVTEGRLCPGASTAIIIDNYRAGVELGRWVTGYIQRSFGGRAIVLDVGFTGPSTEARSRGFEAGMLELRPQGCRILRVDGQGVRERAKQAAGDALTVHPDINVIFGVNDVSALGALDAYRAAGLDDRDLLVVSFGLEGDEIRDLLLQGGPLKACMALFPELVSRACVDAAVCAHNGLPLPELIHPPCTIVTADTLQDYYEYHEGSGRWSMRFDRAEQITHVSPQYVLLNQCQPRSFPGRIGYVLNFSTHAYYQSVVLTMQAYARQKQIALEIVDASQDAAQELDQIKHAIGATAAQLVDDGDTIILDAGDTVQSLARALRNRRNITVITNSYSVLQELADRPDITLIASGGVLRHASRCFIGHQAEANIRELRVDTAFIGATGLSVDFGISNSNIDEAAVKRAMLDAARTVVLLAECSKIGVESLVQVAPLASIHHLVTDPDISERDRQSLIQAGVNVVVCDDLRPA